MEIPLNHSTMVNPSSNGVHRVAKIGPCPVHLPVDRNPVLPWRKNTAARGAATQAVGGAQHLGNNQPSKLFDFHRTKPPTFALCASTRSSQTSSAWERPWSTTSPQPSHQSTTLLTQLRRNQRSTKKSRSKRRATASVTSLYSN
ncbi:hypothetical protein E2562_033099 [Oryza meyeriana var. granulata]|uniref:Uncharacterized protein n=1 Tax=Oryza meyeriana var. granulata TaxID=110450 RepID=A0A6G1ES14_9ORYZ|nr:hypothetical protein E2562_033099 [Oryza meyeriana var. granulata]